jgi:lysozyme
MNLAEMLEDEEARVKHAYLDSEGYLTIGIGRLIDKKKGGGLSDDEIDYLLANDIRNKTREVLKALPWVADLDEVRRNVLIAMSFQMGTDGLLKFVNTLAMVKAERYDSAAKGMLNSLWARQTPKRAVRMAEMMRTGVYIKKD